MTDTPTDTAPEAITQADREAAANSINEQIGRVTAEEEFVRKGEWDFHPRVVEMARHRRLTSHSAGEGLREAAFVWRKLQQCRSVGDPHGWDHYAKQLTAFLTPPSDAGSTTRSGGEGVLDWAALGHEYAEKALSGGWPQVTSPQYALSGAFTEMAREIERLRALATTPSPDASPDSGETWMPVPVEPTDAMMIAWRQAPGLSFHTAYAAMLAASPRPSPSPAIVKEAGEVDAMRDSLLKEVRKAASRFDEAAAQARANHQRTGDVHAALNVDCYDEWAKDTRRMLAMVNDLAALSASNAAQEEGR